MDAALGGQLEFQFFHAWFNGLFLASALLSLAGFYWQYTQVMSLMTLRLERLRPTVSVTIDCTSGMHKYRQHIGRHIGTLQTKMNTAPSSHAVCPAVRFGPAVAVMLWLDLIRAQSSTAPITHIVLV